MKIKLTPGSNPFSSERARLFDGFRRVNVDFPVWMIRGLDAEAQRLVINRQAFIKVWLGERLEKNTG